MPRAVCSVLGRVTPTALDSMSSQPCAPCEHDFHLLCFPQWQGSDARGHLSGGQLAAALVKTQLGLSLPSVIMQVEVASEAAAEDDDNDKSGAGVQHLSAIIRQSQCARALLDPLPKTSRVFTVGGDCGVEVQPCSRANACFPGMALVWFDAHADLNTPSSSPSGHFHGMPVRTLLGEGPAGLQLPSPLTPAQVIYVGTRDLDSPEQAYIDAHSMCLLPPRPSSTLASRLAAALRSFSTAYIHVDLDVIDPAEFPCTCCPTADGLSLQTLLECISTVKRTVDLVAGVGLTECCGDPSSHASQLAAVIDGLATSLASE